MSEYDDLRKTLQDLLFNKFSPKPSFTRGILGDGNGNVTVPERSDKSYVRFNRGANEFFEVFNRTVNPVEGWPVLIGELPWQPGLTQVVDTDWSAFEQSGWGDNIGDTSPHAPTHEWPDGSPGSDPVNVYARSIVPLRTYANSTGTVIYTNAYEYEYQGSGHVWGGTPGLDLSPVISSMPSGTMRFMGVYLDPDTNTLGIVTGATTVFTSAFDPPRVQFPANVLPSARVRVYGSQANVTEFDMRDARQPFSYYPTGTTSAGGGAWPGTGKAKINNVEYDSLTAALAALGTSGTIKLGDGFFNESVTVTGAYHIIGTGKNSTVITDAVSGGVLSTRSDVTLENMTIINTFVYVSGVSSPTALDINSDSVDNGNVEAINCNFVVSADAPDDARAVRVNIGGLHRLLECDGSASNTTGTSEAISFGDGSLEIRGGIWSGETYDLQAYSTADTLVLNDPIFTNDDNGDHISIDSAVMVEGKYLDGDGNIIQPSTSNDIYPGGDDAGLFERENAWKTVAYHFNVTTDISSNFTWDAVNFSGTPNNIAVSDNSIIRIYDSTGTNDYFAYRTLDSTVQVVISARVSLTGLATATYGGIRFDNPSSPTTNFFEIRMYPGTASGLAKFTVRYDIGAGVVSNDYADGIPLGWYVPQLSYLPGGTFGLFYYTKDTPRPAVLGSVATIWNNTTLRCGIIVGHGGTAGANARAALFDWWSE